MGWDIGVREKIYLRLANEIFFRILHGEYAQGEKLPSYAELAKKAGCSPETVRKAIRELQQQGVVENLRVGYAVTSDSSQITAYRQRYLISIKEEYLTAKAKAELAQPITK